MNHGATSWRNTSGLALRFWWARTAPAKSRIQT